MSMLDRYKKTGGFKQLVALLETCGPAKRDKFMELIKAENALWADTLATKILDINRIFSWKDETLQEIVGTVQDLTLTMVMHGTDEKNRSRILGFLTHGRRRNVEDIFNSSKPTAAEIATMQMKLIETVRKMVADGSLRFDKIDPELVIDEEIEDKLAKGAFEKQAEAASKNPFAIEYENSVGDSAPESAAPTPTPDSGSRSEATVMEIAQLKKKLDVIAKENAVLRHELSVAKNKLDQIKKIA